MSKQVNLDGGTSPAYGGTSPAKLWTIVVDPGHGGRDPGAVGRVHGLKERDVVLEIAQRMVSISETGRIGIVLTRDSNKIRRTLQERARKATTLRADAFLSLHCNAFGNTLVTGHETFFWHSNLRGQRLAQFIVSDIVRATGWVNRGVKSNNTFGVLRGTQGLAAVLVEYDFISNPLREVEFMNPERLQLLAETTYYAVDRYLSIHG